MQTQLYENSYNPHLPVSSGQFHSSNIKFYLENRIVRIKEVCIRCFKKICAFYEVMKSFVKRLNINTKVLAKNKSTTSEIPGQVASGLGSQFHENAGAKKIVSSDQGTINPEFKGSEDKEQPRARELFERYQVLIKKFSDGIKYQHLFSANLNSVYFSQLVLIRDPKLRKSLLEDLPEFLESIQHYDIGSVSFNYNGAPLLPIYSELCRCLGSDNKDTVNLIYKKVYKKRKRFKHKEAYISFLELLTKLRINNRKHVAVILDYVLDNFKRSKDFILHCQNLRFAIENSGSFNDLIEKNFHKGNLLPILNNIFEFDTEYIIEFLQLEASTSTKCQLMALSPRNRLALLGVIKNVKLYFSRHPAIPPFIMKALKNSYKALLEGNYKTYHYETLELSEPNKKIWKTNSRVQIGEYSLEDTDDPWEILNATNEIGGCLSIYHDNTAMPVVNQFIISNGTRLITLSNSKQMVARAYFFLNVDKLTCNISLFKTAAGFSNDDQAREIFVSHINEKLTKMNFQLTSVEDMRNFH